MDIDRYDVFDGEFITLKGFYFEDKKFIIFTTQKIGSSFLENLSQKINIFCFGVSFDKWSKTWNLETSNYNKQQIRDGKITEKQFQIKLLEMSNIINSSQNYFLVRNPVERFRSGFLQTITESRFHQFYDSYDHFKRNEMGFSKNLLSKIKHEGFESLKNFEIKIFEDILYETIRYSLPSIIDDQHISYHNLDLITIFNNTDFDKKILCISNLDKFLLKNDIISEQEIKNIDRNKQEMLSDKNKNKFFYNLINEIEDKKRNQFAYQLFLLYTRHYLRSELNWYDFLMKEYGEME